MTCEREIAEYEKLTQKEREQRKKVRVIEEKVKGELKREKDKLETYQSRKDAVFGLMCRKLIETPQELQAVLVRIKALDEEQPDVATETVGDAISAGKEPTPPKTTPEEE